MDFLFFPFFKKLLEIAHENTFDTYDTYENTYDSCLKLFVTQF